MNEGRFLEIITETGPGNGGLLFLLIPGVRVCYPFQSLFLIQQFG